MPSTSGILISMITRSGRSFFARSTAVRPSPTSAMTSYSSEINISRRSSLINDSSSAMIMRRWDRGEGAGFLIGALYLTVRRWTVLRLRHTQDVMLEHRNGRGERIRTSDHRYPIPLPSRPAPHPEPAKIIACCLFQPGWAEHIAAPTPRVDLFDLDL